MPNHVTTEITGPEIIRDSLTRPYTTEERRSHEEDQENARRFWAERGQPENFIPRPLADDARVVDFGLLIPEPENIEQGGCSGRHKADEVCWYSWHIANWGTKWNGYSFTVTELSDGRVRLRFDTAWSHPTPVIEALSRKLPTVELEVEFADEDLGHNLDQYTIQNGEVLQSTEFEEGSSDAYEFAANLKHSMSYAAWRKRVGAND